MLIDPYHYRIKVHDIFIEVEQSSETNDRLPYKHIYQLDDKRLPKSLLYYHQDIYCNYCKINLNNWEINLIKEDGVHVATLFRYAKIYGNKWV